MSLIAFLDTRVKIHNTDKIMKQLGAHLKREASYEHSDKGRIWITSNPIVRDCFTGGEENFSNSFGVMWIIRSLGIISVHYGL